MGLRLVIWGRALGGRVSLEGFGVMWSGLGSVG